MDRAKRSFLKLIFFSVNGALTVLLSVPVLGYLLAPLFQKVSAQWVEAGAAADYAGAEPKRARLRYVSTLGIREEARSLNVWVSREGENVVAFSAECPHVGCNVVWRSDEGIYGCPCHKGRFNRQGEVLSGPPPGPMMPMAAKIEDGKIYIKV